MRRNQLHINLNLLFFVYHVSTSYKTYQATALIVSTRPKVYLNSTNHTSISDHIQPQVHLSDQGNENDSQGSFAFPAIDLVVENSTLGHYSESQLRRHSYNVSDSLSSNSSADSQVSEDLSTSDSSLLTRAISPKMDIGDNLVDVGGSSDLEEDLYGSVEGSSSNLSEQRAVRELTKILSRGLAGVTDHVGVEKLENWKNQQKYRKKMKDDRARLFEDILMAAIESHPDKSERYKTKRTKHSTYEDSPQNRSVPIFGNYINNLDPELAQDAETVVQNLQGIASVFGGGSGSEDASPGIRDDRATQEETDSDKMTTTSRPILRQFNKIKKQLSNRRKQFDQIKKIFNQDYTTTQSDPSSPQQTNHGKHYRDPNYGYDDEFTIVDDYNQKLLSRRSPSGPSIRDRKLEQLSSYLLENPSALGSALAELSSGSFASSRPATSRIPYTSSLLHGDGRAFSRRYRESVSAEDPLHSDDVTRKPSRQDSSNNNGVRDVGPDVEKAHKRAHEETSGASQSSIAVTQTGSTSASTMSTAETLLLNSLKERQLMNLMRLETVLAEKQQASVTNKNAALSSIVGPPIASRNFNQPSASTPERVSNSNSTNHHQNSRAQESIKNQKQSSKEELHHFMVVNPNPASTRPEDYGTDLNSLNIDPYDAAALDQSSSTGKLNRFKDWTDVSQSETRSSVVKDEVGSMGAANRNNDLQQANKNDQRDGFTAHNKRGPSVKRVLDNHHQFKELSGRPEQRPGAVHPVNQMNRFQNEDRSVAEQEEEEEAEEISRMAMNNEGGHLEEDDPEGVYVKLDRIALGSEMRAGPVDYFSAYKNEMKAGSQSLKADRMSKVARRVAKPSPRVEGDEEDEGGAAMWAR